MKVGICFKMDCLHKNESETAYCKRIDCPLMEKSNEPTRTAPEQPKESNKV